MSKVTLIPETCKPFKLATFVVAVTALLWGAAAALSQADTTVAGRPNAKYAIRDPKLPTNISPAARARAQRTATINKMREQRKFIAEVLEGKQSVADKPDNGGAK